MTLYFTAYSFSQCGRCDKGCTTEHEDKFFATIPGEYIIPPGNRLNEFGQVLEDEVPRRMAPRIIDLLEVVNIKQDDSQTY